MSNIDKHRRLPLLAWFPDLVYWFSDEEEDGYQWRPQKMSPVKFVDGTLLGYLSNRSGSKLPRADLRHEMNLVIDDDPAGLHSSIDKRWIIGMRRSPTSFCKYSARLEIDTQSGSRVLGSPTRDERTFW